jgi:acetyl-CoA carboxylase biotin carboxylase subunit
MFMKVKEIRKVAIANRGEVAVRIICACQELGLKTVLLHSEADRQSRAYRLADEQVCIGPSPSNESYLHIERNIQAALSVQADAVHPGFGFLSENANFARACEKAGIIFIGPRPDSIDLFGDKISAKNLVQKIGAPTIPGYEGKDQKIENLKNEAKKIGFPVIVKAAAGGGGRGMKIIRNAEEAQSQIESAQREALNAFGSPQVFLEKYLDHAKHIEFQIFGAANGEIFNLHDRECTIQRRHQKIIEEARAAGLDEKLRKQMSDVAVQIAREAKYLGAGTVEFLVQDNQFFFIEMNTRLQVEHPVTEMILGIDLVKAQILTAQGQNLSWKQDSLIPRGHAIECRIYTEDPYKNGIPSTGILGDCLWPEAYARRFEVGFESGDEITSYYDSMIAKVIVWDEDRPRALVKMLKTLDDCVIFGLKTNIPYLKKMLQHPDFSSAVMTTKFIEQHFPNGLKLSELSNETKEWAQSAWVQIASGTSLPQSNKNPFRQLWRNV